LSAAVSLVGLTLYIMRDFLSEIDWWLYLLLVGILLIFIAAVGEYCKSHGESFKHKVGKLFADWDNGDND
jgi:uncharacterized membrane protein YbhN (UPF0104 family)